MFENIGKKIKAFTKVLFWIGVCIFGILAIVVADMKDSFFAFLLIAGIGVLVSYLSVIVLYAFGQLVDNSDIVAENSERQVKLLKDIKMAFAESYTGLCNKANRQANLLEEIQGELARCHAVDAAEEPRAEAAEEAPAAPTAETPAEDPVESAAEVPVGLAEEASIAPAAEASTEPVEEAPAAPVEVLTSITMEPEEAPVEEPEVEASPVPTITCKKCGFALTDDDCDLSDSVFCPNCGSKLSEQAEPEGVCPGCGFNKAFGKFCPRCGLRLHE